MQLKSITDGQKNDYEKLVTHVIQSWEWGEFRKSLGLPVLRFGLYDKEKLVQAFQFTLHKIPFTKYYMAYLPKGPLPDKNLFEALTKICKEENCAFIKLEPDILREEIPDIDPHFLPSPKALFTKDNFILDLSKTEEELLKNMHQKFRYNIKIAQKHGIVVEERTDDEAFKIHLKLYFETTKRQGYHGHDENYHLKVWQSLNKANMARVLIAFYTPARNASHSDAGGPAGTADKIPLSSWELFNFKDTLYYPYGGSSDQYKNVMATNLLAWEAIKLGKKLGLKTFDLWGALGQNPDPNHPWYGFHRFKSQMGGNLVEYAGTFDLVFNYPVYWIVTAIDRFTKLKVLLFKLLRR